MTNITNLFTLKTANLSVIVKKYISIYMSSICLHYNLRNILKVRKKQPKERKSQSKLKVKN